MALSGRFPSPLPFGVSAPRLAWSRPQNHWSMAPRLHCLSAFRPPGSRFMKRMSLIEKSLHCLSAFRPPGSAAMNTMCPSRKPSLHCLSAFRPPGSQRRRKIVAFSSCVSIAFRRFGPPALLSPSLTLPPELAVSIAFRRFGPPAHIMNINYGLKIVSPLPFGVSAPRLPATATVSSS